MTGDISLYRFKELLGAARGGEVAFPARRGRAAFADNLAEKASAWALRGRGRYRKEPRSPVHRKKGISTFVIHRSTSGPRKKQNEEKGRRRQRRGKESSADPLLSPNRAANLKKGLHNLSGRGGGGGESAALTRSTTSAEKSN